MTARLTGCGTAIVTPFTDDGAVDEAALRGLVEWQIEAGIDFLVPCGSTGEAQTLSAEERERVVRIVVETAAGRTPVMAGATSNDTRAAVEETRRMVAAGVDYILSACPYYNKPTQEGLYRHFCAVLEASERPVVLYNVPGRTAVNLAPRTALRLAEHPRCAGIKEASGDLAQIMELIFERPDSFSVLSGDDWLALAVIACGGDGLISVTSNEVPDRMTALVREALAGNLADAREHHRQLLPLMHANFLESNPAPVKACLAQMGKIRNVLRLPLIPVSTHTADALEHAMSSLGGVVGYTQSHKS